jgi:hypothetical protein
MIGIVKKYFESKSKMIEANIAESQSRINESEVVSKMIQEASDIVYERPDADGFLRIQPIDEEKGHLQTTQLEMIRKAREYCRWEPNAKGSVQTMLNYVMGKGVIITPKSDDPMVWHIWREFWTSDRNKMELKQFEMVNRTFRDGELFIEFFDKDEDDNATGKTTIRFIDPLLIRNPGDADSKPDNFNSVTTKSGVEHDANDVEKVIRYWVKSSDGKGNFRSVLADSMIHIKINADSDQKRGESFIMVIMRMIVQYKQWLDNRIILNKMRTAIVLIKKISGTPSQVSQVANTFKTVENQPAGWNKKQNIRGGSTIVAGPGVDYKMESPNINAGDVKDDGRNIKLNMAAGLNLPEYIFGDASNANFASSLIAESPFVKSIEYWQIIFEYWIKRIYKKVIQNAVEAKLVDAPDDKEFMRRLKKVNDLLEQEGEKDENGLTPKERELKNLMPNGKLETPIEIFFGCDLQWGEIIHRNQKEHTEALVLAREEGWVSDPSASASLGWDLAEESRKQNTFEEEAERTGNRLLGIKSKEDRTTTDENDLDDEANDIINNMTDDEKKQMLTKNPQDIAQLLMDRLNAGANGKQQASQVPAQGGQS